MRSIRTRQSAFTLVEILIVVIILGILAAIVIPQFTNASTEARNNSLRSTVQSIRSQIELYKVQHADLYPTSGAVAGAPADGTWSWAKLTGKTDAAGAADDDGAFGPYLQTEPVNSVRSQSGVQIVEDDAAAASATAAATDGYVFSQSTGKFWAFDGAGALITD